MTGFKFTFNIGKWYHWPNTCCDNGHAIRNTTDDFQILATHTKSAMRSRDVKIQIFNEVTFGRWCTGVLDHVLRFIHCKDLSRHLNALRFLVCVAKIQKSYFQIFVTHKV